jgi:transposase
MGGFVGIDVSKDQLDVAFRPEGRHLQVSNDPRGIIRLVRMLERSQPQLVVLEASGGYEAARGGLDAMLGCLKRQIAAIDKRLADLIREAPSLRQKAELLRSAPGVGQVAAATLLARLPELGKIDRKKIARHWSVWRRLTAIADNPRANVSSGAAAATVARSCT